ncbi:MAG: hypothetical protein AABZ55_08955, partial [Bdellovibrionota bacterium]
AGCLQRAVAYYKLRGDERAAAYRRRILDDYVQKSAEEIRIDPVGFKATLIPGQLTYVPDNLWEDE